MVWVVKGEEAGVTDYYFDKLSCRQKVVIGAFAATFDDPLYHFKSEWEGEILTKETKQDVFDRLLKEHCKTILDLNPASAETDVKQIVENVFRDNYAAASPCKLPVIPQTVGEYIKWGNTYGISTYMMFSFKFVRIQGFSKLTDEAEDWIISNSDAFVMAWLLNDWEVEDEPA